MITRTPFIRKRMQLEAFGFLRFDSYISQKNDRVLSSSFSSSSSSFPSPPLQSSLTPLERTTHISTRDRLRRSYFTNGQVTKKRRPVRYSWSRMGRRCHYGRNTTSLSKTSQGSASRRRRYHNHERRRSPRGVPEISRGLRSADESRAGGRLRKHGRMEGRAVAAIRPDCPGSERRGWRGTQTTGQARSNATSSVLRSGTGASERQGRCGTRRIPVGWHHQREREETSELQCGTRTKQVGRKKRKIRIQRVAAISVAQSDKVKK